MMKLTTHIGKIVFFCLFIVLALADSAQADKRREFYMKGEEYFQQGNYPMAIENFEKVVELDPNFAPAYNILGLAHFRSQARLSDVEWFFKNATDIDPNYVEAHTNLCKIYYNFEEYLKAEKSCLKALAISPDYGEAEMTLGWIYLVGKQSPDKAVYYFLRALKKSQQPRMYFGLGMAYAKKGDGARVLDIVTTLNEMGAYSFATQLEAAVRTEDKSQLIVEDPMKVNRRQPGTLVNSGRRKSAPAPQADLDGPVGQMRIRLKGHLVNPTPE